MIVNHTLLKLGEDNLKRPEIWCSALAPKNANDTIGSVSLNIKGTQNLKVLAKTIDGLEESTSYHLSIGNHGLYGTTHTVFENESFVASSDIGNHKLKNIAREFQGPDDEGSVVSLQIGQQKLHIWGVRAESLDEANAKLSLSIGNQKLHEEL